MFPSDSMSNSIDKTFANAELSSQSNCASSSKRRVQDFLGFYIFQQGALMQFPFEIWRFRRQTRAISMLAILGMRAPFQIAGTIVQLIPIKVIALMFACWRKAEKCYGDQTMNGEMFPNRGVAKNNDIIVISANSWLNELTHVSSAFRSKALDAAY